MYEYIETKKRFQVLYQIKNGGAIYLRNIIVDEKWRDQGLAKRIIFTFWRVSETLHVPLYVVNVISPVIEAILKKYYIIAYLPNNTFKILGIEDPDYSESILKMFLDIYRTSNDSIVI